MNVYYAPKLDRCQLQSQVKKTDVIPLISALKQLAGTYLEATYVTTEHKYLQKLHAPILHKKNIQTMRLSLFTSNYKTYLNYDFNSNHINKNEFEAFIKRSSILGNYSYPHVVSKGRLSYLEIAVDYWQKHTSGILVHKPYATKFDSISDKNQLGGTKYCGSKNLELQIVTYDKSEELTSKGWAAPHQKLLRIEAKIKIKNFSVDMLQDIANPFDKLIVCDWDQLKSVQFTNSEVWKQFLNGAYVYNVYTSLKKQPLKYRKPIIALLKKNQCYWWRPQNLMKEFPKQYSRQLHIEYSKSMIGECGKL